MTPSDAEPGDALSSGPVPEDELRRLRMVLRRAVARACPRWFLGHEEDIVQNALLQLVRAVDRGGRNSGFSSMYLAKAAHGATVDEIRRWCRGKTAVRAGEAMLEGLPSDRAGPERESGGREIGRAIRQCLGRLVRPRRVAVTFHLQGCSAPETARRLGWTLAKTEKLVYRGLADLRRCLSAKGVRP